MEKGGGDKKKKKEKDGERDGRKMMVKQVVIERWEKWC